MRILYITGQSPWPPVVGSRIRSFNILRMLAQRHDVTVALLSSAADQIASFEGDLMRLSYCRVVPAEALSRWRWSRSVTLERNRPALASSRYALFQSGLRTLMESAQPDVVWFFRLNSVWQTGCHRHHVPTICDVDDLEAKAYGRAIRLLPILKRGVAALDYPQFLRAQTAAARACDLLLVSNPDDAVEAAEMTGRPVQVAPNGYDFSVPPDFDRLRRCRIVFYGALGYGPNIDGLRWFVRDVWPKIHERVPEACLDIAGKISPVIGPLGREPGVRLCGFVESIRSFVDDAALLVVPLRMGGGTRIKILEAWGLGLPVVSTTLGCEGLQAVDGETLIVADDPDGFARSCIGLLLSPAHGRDMAQKAFEHARLNFDWSLVDRCLEKALEAVMRQTSH